MNKTRGKPLKHNLYECTQKVTGDKEPSDMGRDLCSGRIGEEQMGPIFT